MLHAAEKLRTVIWDFAGEPIPASLLADIRRLLKAGFPDGLDELVTPPECAALRERAAALLEETVFPTDPSGMRYPWPLV